MRSVRKRRSGTISSVEIRAGDDGEDDAVVEDVRALLARPDAAGIRALDVVFDSHGFDDVLRAIAEAPSARGLTDLSLRAPTTSGDGCDLSLLDGHPALRRIEIAPGIVSTGTLRLPELRELVLDPAVLDGDSVCALPSVIAGTPKLCTLELVFRTGDSVDIAAGPADLAPLLACDARLRTLVLGDAPFYLDELVPTLQASPLVARLKTLYVGGRRADVEEKLALPCRVIADSEPAIEDPALRDRILAAFDDEAPWLVLADWLAEREDPRGELILVQHALHARPSRNLRWRERALLRRGRFLAELQAEEIALRATWFMGHLRTASMTCDRDHSWAPSLLLGLPVARYLRRLEIDRRRGSKIDRAELERTAPPGCEIVVRPS